MATGDKKPVVMEADRAVPGGVATLNENGTLEASQCPDANTVGAYSKDETYSSGTIDSLLQQKSNPNLLDNWYLVNPICQRGGTTYTGSGYFLDRWSSANSGVSVTINDDYVTVQASNAYSLYQRHPLELWKALAGKTVTISALTTNGLGSYTEKLPTDLSVKWDTGQFLLDGHIFDIFGTPNKNECAFRMFTQDTGGTINLIAAKLELGDRQTLAHQDADGNWVLNDAPPNYQQELAKCQWYLRSLPGNRVRYMNLGTNDVGFFVPMYPLLRANPTTITLVSSKMYIAEKGNTAASDFSFSSAWGLTGGLKINANKAAHGLTEPILYCNDDWALVSAEL